MGSEKNMEIMDEVAKLKSEKEETQPIEDRYEPVSLSKKENAETIKTEIPALIKITVIGKIDLDAINAKIKPIRKTKEERRKESSERIAREIEERKTLRNARGAKRKMEQEKIEKQKEIEPPVIQEEPPAEVPPVVLEKTKMEKLKYITSLKWIGKMIK